MIAAVAAIAAVPPTPGSSAAPAPAQNADAGRATPSHSSTNHGYTVTSPDGIGAPKSSKSALGFADRRLITKAADASHAEAELARLAVERASDPGVRKFAEQLLADYKLVTAEFRGIASNQHVDIDRTGENDRTVRRLRALSGAEFDREFVTHIAEGHERAVENFTKMARQATDVEIKRLATKSVPQFQGHLQQARALQRTLESATDGTRN